MDTAEIPKMKQKFSSYFRLFARRCSTRVFLTPIMNGRGENTTGARLCST